MKIDCTNRRMFLRGTGAIALTLPFLRSLAPKNALAETSQPVRFVQLLNMYGARTDQFYGKLSADEEVEPNVFARQLKDYNGPLSPLVGTEFDHLRDKISLVHGMDAIVENPNHNLLLPTCASGYDKGLDGDLFPPLSGQQSVDVLMAASTTVYDAATPASQRLLVLNPSEGEGFSQNASFSWKKNATETIEMVRPTKTTIGIVDLLSSGFENKSVQNAERENALLDAVYDDYRTVRDSSRISKEDKARLETYMALVRDASLSPGVSCAAPEFDEEVDLNALMTNQFRLLAAAMMCDLTRVVSVALPVVAVDAHAAHHDLVSWNQACALDDDFVRAGKAVAQLAGLFEETQVEGGTLLDQSILYWSMQYGNALPSDAHRTDNLPVLVAGRAGGQLRSGYYVDYRKNGALSDDVGRGVPINNLLVTFMNCMGLSSAEYERDEAGFGYYNTRFFETDTRPNVDFWSSTEGRRSPLPFLYEGQDRG